RAPQRHRRPCAPTRPTGRTGLVRAGRLRAGARRAGNPAYLASLAETHAPATIRRRLSAIGKMHRFNDLPWNPAHRDIQEPLRGLLHALLPVPATLLELGPNDPETVTWLAAHWGTQCLRHVEVRPGRPGGACRP